MKLFFFLFLLSTSLSAVTSGPNSCATFADDATVGTVAWINPGNAAASDSSNATAGPVGFPVTTHYLKSTNCGFSIPSLGRIRGITVEVQESYPGTGSYIQNSIRLVVGGAITGTDQSTGSSLPSSKQYVSWGSSTNLWGLLPTPAQINASTFGFVFSATQDSDPDRTFSVDHVRITIDYVLELGKMFLIF